MENAHEKNTKGSTMIKPVFGIKNILIFLFFLCLSVLLAVALLAAIDTLFDSIKEVDWGNIVGSILFGGGMARFFILTTSTALSQVVPKYFACMQVVGLYIRFSDLKDLLENEEFQPVNFPKNRYEDIQVSQNWVYTKGIYIPKKMIIAIFRDEKNITMRTTIHFSSVRTIDDRKFRFMSKNSHDNKNSLVTYLIKQMDIPTLKLPYDERENYIGDFYERFYKNKNKREDFITFLKRD